MKKYSFSVVIWVWGINYPPKMFSKLMGNLKLFINDFYGPVCVAVIGFNLPLAHNWDVFI